MVNKSIVGAVPKGENNIFTIRHQEYLVIRPTQVYVGLWACFKLVEFSTNFFVGDRQSRETFKCRTFPLRPLAFGFCFASHHRPLSEAKISSGIVIAR